MSDGPRDATTVVALQNSVTELYEIYTNTRHPPPITTEDAITFLKTCLSGTIASCVRREIADLGDTDCWSHDRCLCHPLNRSLLLSILMPLRGHRFHPYIQARNTPATTVCASLIRIACLVYVFCVCTLSCR